MKKSAFVIVFILPFFAFPQQNSVLSSGNWYKIAVEETGIYKITYDDLVSYGIDVDNIDPHHLSLYGNPAGMLPEPLEAPCFTDLQQMAIQVVGEEDGKFDTNDYILFFGQSPDVWEHDKLTNRFHYITNLYTEKTFYFLTTGTENGKRISVQPSSEEDVTGLAMLYDYLISHEDEIVNPGKSGKRWLGEAFSETDSLSFYFNISNTEYIDSNYFNTTVAANSTETSSFTIIINGEHYATIEILPINGVYEVYNYRRFDSVFTGQDDINVTFIYNRPNDTAQAWLDYFEIRMKANPPVINTDQTSFRSIENVGPGEVTDFVLLHGLPENLTIWNVTDPLNITDLDLQISGDNVTYRLKTDSLLEFHAVTGANYYSSEFFGQVENQNLHAIEPPEFLIVTHPDFLSQATQLVTFHQQEDELSSAVFTTEQVYNEFSSGAQDITAIRNFVRYLREESGADKKPEYLLLFGDASFDYLDRVENNTNFVPTYESKESSNVVFSFASDDFFGLKDPGSYGDVQLGVGRLPVTTVAEAEEMTAKIVTYYSSEILTPYKNEWMFISDDGDNNIHLKQAEILADAAKTGSPVFNFTKNYLDFFEPVMTEEGQRIPEVNAITNHKVDDGVFYVNYTGHGGPEYMANENVLTKEEINNWLPNKLLSIWVTATCAMGWYDDPEVVSLAEYIQLKEDAGAIGFITTSRPTFANANLLLNLEVINKLADQSLQGPLRLGDLARYSQNRSNDEKWVLLGDPALRIPFPEFNVSTLTINGEDIENYTDTIAPGSHLTFEGQVESKEDGSLQSGFNGKVYLKVFAPEYFKTTQGNASPVTEIAVQDSILVMGEVEVSDGEFEIQVALPSHYYKNYGNLKLSWYAENGESDANGYYDQLMFGGEPSAVDEDELLLENIKVYPTVFSNRLKLEFPAQINSRINCKLYNTCGVVVFETERLNSSGTSTIDLPGLQKGMYILRIDSETGSKHFKLFRN